MAVLAPIALMIPAQADAPRRFVFDFELVASIGVLLVLVAVAIVVTFRMRSNARTGDVAPAPEHSLAHYQNLLEKGLIDRQEFERIRALLSEQHRTPPINP